MDECGKEKYLVVRRIHEKRNDVENAICSLDPAPWTYGLWRGVVWENEANDTISYAGDGGAWKKESLGLVKKRRGRRRKEIYLKGMIW